MDNKLSSLEITHSANVVSVPAAAMLSPSTDDRRPAAHKCSERCDALSEKLESCPSAAPVENRTEAVSLASWRLTTQILRHGDM